MKRFVLGILSVVVMMVPVMVVGADDEVLVVKATELVSLYRENTIRFYRDYYSAMVQVEGELNCVRLVEGYLNPVLLLEAESPTAFLVAYCKMFEMYAAAYLSAGDIVVVVGECKVTSDLGVGWDTVALTHCVIKR
jgi:hypothetical protein